MSLTKPLTHSRNLNPTAPEFLPATNPNPTAPEFLPATNPNPVPFFIPTRIYLPPPCFIHLPRALPPPHLLPPTIALPPLHLLPPTSATPTRALPPLNLLPPTSATPTRALMLLPVPNDVTESSLRRDMEMFGEVRGVQMERVNEGIVTIHFYNLKDSRKALMEIRDLYMQQQQEVHFFTTACGLVSGRIVWAHYGFPQLNALPEGNNQGSLVVMNLEPTVSSSTLRHIFQAYGHVKELRETPYKREQRFVEFFDVRDAAKALSELNGKVISGKAILIQFSRPGGLSKKIFFDSRFNKSFLSNNHNHYHSPPTPPRIRHPRIQSSMSENELYEQHYKNNKKKNKKHMKKKINDTYFIDNAESNGLRDGRTTVMIKNIPNKYTQKLVLNLLDIHCNECNQKIINEGNKTPMSSYDFVYLPIDFSNKCNMGYGFVNMTSPEAVCRLYKAFHNQHWGVFNSRKICEVTYARLQGLETLKEHFKNSRLPGVGTENYMPVFFSPPRDGKLLPEPIPIVDLETKSMDDDESCHSGDEFVSDKTSEGSDGCCLGRRRENGGI